MNTSPASGPIHRGSLVRFGGGVAAHRVRLDRQERHLGKPPAQGGYDNSDPRSWLARQGDWRARANAAQANSFESLPFFIGAVIIAHQLGARQTWLDFTSMLFVMLRMFYIMMYVSSVPTARSAVWAGAFMVNVAILFVGYR